MQNRLLDLVALALRTPTAPETWFDVIDAVTEAIGAVSATLLLADSEYRTRPEPIISRHLREMAPDVHALHMNGGDADDAPAIRALLARQPLHLYSEMDLYGVAHVADLPPSRMRAAQRVISGVAWRAGVQLNAYVDRFDLLMLHMPETARADGEPAVSVIAGVAPAFSAALRLKRVFEALQAQYRAIIACFDHLGLGTVLLTQDARIIEMNALARGILGEADGLRRDETGRLRCDEDAVQMRLTTVVASAWRAAHREGLDASASVLAPRRSGRPPYLLAVHALIDAQAEIAPGFACALCFIADPARATPLSVDGLRLLGRLSAAETDVCARIIAGQGAAEIAAARGVSTETVKTQRRALLAKLGARDRTDLVRLAIALRVPLRAP
jgi:DNA-binding NarL/FixJ family response regulator